MYNAVMLQTLLLRVNRNFWFMATCYSGDDTPRDIGNQSGAQGNIPVEHLWREIFCNFSV